MEDPNILLESIDSDLQIYRKTSLSLKNNLKLLFFNQNYDIDKLYNLFTNSPDELKNVVISQSNITIIETQLNTICDMYEIEHFDYILWDTISEEYIYYYEFLDFETLDSLSISIEKKQNIIYELKKIILKNNFLKILKRY